VQFKTAMKMVDAISKLTNEHIEKHKKNSSDDKEDKDFVDFYLDQVKNTTDPTSSFYGHAGETSLVATMLDLFLAGTETTSSTLLWGILFMMQHPDVQERVQEELDTVLGNRATASLDEKTRLPYTCAVILEISRKASLVPVIGHTTTVNCEFEGYKIPAGTIVMGNLIGIHHDERFWTKPDVFDPERF